MTPEKAREAYHYHQERASAQQARAQAAAAAGDAEKAARHWQANEQHTRAAAYYRNRAQGRPKLDGPPADWRSRPSTLGFPGTCPSS